MKNNPFYISLNFRIFPKARPRIGKYGKWYTPTSKKEYALAEEIAYEMRKKGLIAFGENDKLAIDCRFYFVGKASGDIDNFLKALIDSLEGIAFLNDKQIKKGSLEVIENCQEDRIEFSLKRIDEQN